MADWTNKIIFLPSVTSTNDYLKEKARCGAEEGTVVWAAEQTVGRGRQNRHWESRPGLGLYCSILLRPQEPFSRLPFYTLFPALAVVEAMEACCNLAVQIKWPNDLVIKKSKMGGILTEASLQGNNLHYVIIGLGLNVYHQESDFSPSLAPHSTSIAREGGRIADLDSLLQEILQVWPHYYQQHHLLPSLVDLIEKWENHCNHMNRRVEVKEGNTIRCGLFAGLNSDGFGRLLIDGTEVTLAQGELSLREVKDVAGC